MVIMGQLTPGATLIYERDGNVIYSREAGKTERTVAGYELPVTKYTKYSEYAVWKDITHMATNNPTLADALDRVFELYELCKE